ncbi:MAG: class I SAM-dependent methyltransferase [Actinomycetota bacterium]
MTRLEAGVDAVETGWGGRDERVFTYLPLERELLASLPVDARILDLGCGDGSHMNLLSSGGKVVGLDSSLPLLDTASAFGHVVAGVGERLPLSDSSVNLVHVSHVLHHAHDHRVVLGEIHRILRPGGTLLLIETCDDSPLMRLARRLRPEWETVPVRCRFRFAELVADVKGAGFVLEAGEQFNVLYWIWGFARRRFKPLERLVKQVIRMELAAVRRMRRYSAYGYVVAHKPGQSRVAGSAYASGSAGG